MKRKEKRSVKPSPIDLPDEAYRSQIGPDFVIRHATFHDLKVCEQIAGQYIANGGTLEIDYEEPDAFLYVYTENNEILGYVQIGIFEEDFYCIDDIAVDKKAKGRGIATKLIQFLFEKPKHVFLYVHTKNHRARKLYEHLGFQKVCTIQRFYSHDRDAFKMVKPNDELGWIDFDTFEPLEIENNS